MPPGPPSKLAAEHQAEGAAWARVESISPAAGAD
jgi:hypothetical protein